MVERPSFDSYVRVLIIYGRFLFKLDIFIQNQDGELKGGKLLAENWSEIFSAACESHVYVLRRLPACFI